MDGDQPSPHRYPNLAPRKFPKRQYKKLNRHIWTALICALVLIGAGVSYGGFHWQQHLTAQVAQERQATKPHAADPASGNTNNKLIRPTALHNKTNSSNQRGKLLKKWLTKLHYSSARIQDIMNIYYQAAPFRKRQISQQLRNVTRNHLEESIKLQQVYDILNQAKMINQTEVPQPRYPATSSSRMQPLAQRF